MADSVKIKITGDSKPFNDELDKLGKKAKSAVSGAGSVFKGIMASQIVTKGVSMLTGGLRDAITTGMQFEAAMSQVAAISGATGQELELLTETAKHYGETTAFSASQAAEALNYMALAGWDAQQSVDALGGVLDLAAASGMDLGRASDAVTDYLSAFSMEASQAGYMADLMAYAQSRSNTSASQLADAYGNCASSMHAAGQDIETTTAMLMALANQGIKGSEAGTQMAAVMRDLTQKMDKGQIMIGKTAVKVTDAAGNFRDLNDIIMDVGKATEGMGTAEQSAAIMETFTARSVKAIQTILNEGVENVNQYEEALRGSEGTAAEQAKIMMDNLQGDIKIFKSALEGVQITASESMNTTARAIVQEGTGFLEAINQGGKTGGIGGMFDAVIDQIPALIPKAVKGMDMIANGIQKRLPSLASNLVRTIPGMLAGAGDLVPGLITALTGAASAAVEGLIGNMPSIVGNLIGALPDIVVSSMSGVGNLFSGVINGIGAALKSAGLMNLNLNDRVSEAFKSIDTSGITVGDINVGSISIDGEIDTTSYTEKIATAKSNIETAVDSLKLSDSDAAALKKAILQGSGADALKAALKALKIPDTDINAVTTSISGFRSKMDAVFAEFNVDDSDGSIATSIANYVAQGNSLEEALQLFAGLSAADAKTAAESLQLDLDAAVTAINALNLEGVDTTTIYQACSTTNGDIEAALKMLGADDETIAAALASVDTLKDNITTKLNGAFEAIKTAFTNGELSDDAEAAQTAMEQLDSAAETGHNKIDSWLTDYTTQLNTMNLSAAEYETAVTNAQEKAQAMHDELDATIQAAKDWVTTNAGAATKEVESHISELDGLLSDIEALEARVESLHASLNPRDYVTRGAVERGVLNSQNAQATAIALTAKEYEVAVTEAAQEYAEVEQAALDKIEQANKDLAAGLITVKERNDIEGEANSQIEEALNARTEAEQAAAESYNAHMHAIMQGMLTSNAEAAAALKSVEESRELRTFAADLPNAVSEAVRQNGAGMVTVDELLASMGMDQGNLQALADAIGMSVDDLYTQVGNALKSEDPAAIMANITGSNGNLTNFANGIEQATADALEGVDLSNAATVLTKALEEGWLVATDDIDWSNPEAALRKALVDYVNKTYEDTGTLENEVDVETTVNPTNDPEVEIEEAEQQVKDRPRPPQLVKQEIELEPEITTTGDTAEKIGEAMEDSTEGADSSATVEAEITLEPEVTASEDTAEKIGEAMEESTSDGGGSTTVTPEIQIEPEIKDPETVRQALTTGIQNATTGMKLDDVLNESGMSRADFDNLASTLGFDPAELESAINGAMASFDPASALTGVFAGIDLSPLLQPIGESVGQGMSTGIESSAGEAESAASAMGDQVVQAAGTSVGYGSPAANVIPIGESVGQGMQVGIESSTGEAVAAAESMGQQVVQAAVSAGVDAADGSPIGEALDISAGSGNTGSALSGATRSAVGSAISSGVSAAGSAASIGAAIAQGIARGISSNSSIIAAAARNAAQAALTAAKTALDSHSPSKEMMKVGRWYDQGFALGIDKSASEVVRSALMMAKSAVGAANLRPKFDTADLFGKVESGLQTFADAETQRPVVLVLNGRKVAESLAPDTSKAQGAYNRHVSMGYGTR